MKHHVKCGEDEVGPIARTVIGEYVVSTINRESSAVIASGSIYAETIVFKGGEIVGQFSSGPGDIRRHCQVVQALYEGGEEAINGL